MTVPKTYVYKFDKYKVLVCSYSVVLFNYLIKHTRNKDLIYTGDLELISHKIYNRSTCNCRDIVKESASKIVYKLKTFERVVLPLEILELDRSNARLFVCELYRSHKSPGTKLKIINTAIKNCRSRIRPVKIASERPKNCLWNLFSILNEDIWKKNTALSGRNNSFSNKSVNYRDCCMEIIRELVGKGALPGDLSQKCLYSSDNNRCWYDYCRVMEICIKHNFSAREIADIIKHVAMIDPMQPDPVKCIRDKFETTISSNSSSEQESNNIASVNDSVLESMNSLSNSRSTSSSFSDLIVRKSQSSRKSTSSKYKPQLKTKNERASKTKAMSKKHQSFISTQTETQGDCIHCASHKNYCHPHQLKSNCDSFEHGDSRRISNNYNEKQIDFFDSEDVEFTDYNDFYNSEKMNYYYKEYEKDRDQMGSKRHANEFGQSSSVDFRKISNDRLDEDYDQGYYGDFMRQNEFLNNVDNYIDDDFNYMEEEEEEKYFNLQDCQPKSCLSGSKTSSPKLRQRTFSDKKCSGKKKLYLRYCPESDNDSKLRSSSQPLLSTRSKTYKLLSNTNNVENEKAHYLKDKILRKWKNTVDCFTQTHTLSEIFTNEEIGELKKFPSDSVLFMKHPIELMDNTNNTESANFRSNNSSLNEVRKKTEDKSVQTVSRLDLSQPPIIEGLQSFSQQTKFSEADLTQTVKCRNIAREIFHNDIDHKIIFSPPDLKQISRFPKSKAGERMSKPIDSYSYSINRNANNHSLSRSDSSRNSQIVEIENDGLEKMPSVLVESDGRSVLLYRDKYQIDSNINNVSNSPFYEINSGKLSSINRKLNTNANNSIKSVTVYNQSQSNSSYLKPSSHKCPFPNCPNLVDGSHNYCTYHMESFSPKSQCSPEKCLSRLSCIVGLNKHLLKHNEYKTDSPLHLTTLHRAIYGPYNDEECVRVLNLNSHYVKKNLPIPVKSECLNDESTSIEPIIEPGRRFCNYCKSYVPITSIVDSVSANKPLYSATKLLNNDLQECKELDSGKYVPNDDKGIQSSSVDYHSQPIELALPLTSSDIPNCTNAVLSNDNYNLQSINSTRAPISTSHLLPNEDISRLGLDMPKPTESLRPDYEIIQGELPFKENTNHLEEYQLSETHITPKSIQHQLPCGKIFPINLRLCPIPGCLNLTATNNPPCLDKQYLNNTVSNFKDHNFISVISGKDLLREDHIKQPQAINDKQIVKNISSVDVIGQTANCEVIIEDEQRSQSSSPQKKSKSQKKPPITESLQSKIKTVTTDSKAINHKESDTIMNPSFQKTKDLHEELLDNSEITNANSDLIEHNLKSGSWLEPDIAYHPNLYRNSLKSEVNNFESIIQQKDKPVKVSVPTLESNINHISESHDYSISEYKQNQALIGSKLKNGNIENSFVNLGDIVNNRRTTQNSQRKQSNLDNQKNKYLQQPKFQPKLSSYTRPLSQSSESEVLFHLITVESISSTEPLKLGVNVKMKLEESPESENDNYQPIINHNIKLSLTPATSNNHMSTIKSTTTNESFQKQIDRLHQPISSTNTDMFQNTVLFDSENVTLNHEIYEPQPVNQILSSESMIKERKTDMEQVTNVKCVPLGCKNSLRGSAVLEKEISSENHSYKSQNIKNAEEKNLENTSITVVEYLISVDNSQGEPTQYSSVTRKYKGSIITPSYLPNDVDNELIHSQLIPQNKESLNREQNSPRLKSKKLQKNDDSIYPEFSKKGKDKLKTSQRILSSEQPRSKSLCCTSAKEPTSKKNGLSRSKAESMNGKPADQKVNRLYNENFEIEEKYDKSRTKSVTDRTTYQSSMVEDQSKNKAILNESAIPRASSIVQQKTKNKDSNIQNSTERNIKDLKPLRILNNHIQGNNYKSQSRDIKQLNKLSLNNISILNKRRPLSNSFLGNKSNKHYCNNVDVYNYILEIDVNKQYPGNFTPFMTCKVGDVINNSANIKLVSTSINHLLSYDQLLFDSISQNRSFMVSESVIYKGLRTVSIGRKCKISFSAPDLISTKHSYLAKIPERFHLESDLAVEYEEASSDSLALVIDQPPNQFYYLTTFFIPVQACLETVPWIKTTQIYCKSKRSRIREMFKSSKSHSKSQGQSLNSIDEKCKSDKSRKFMKDVFLSQFRTKILNFIKKYKNNRIGNIDKGSMISCRSNLLFTESSSCTSNQILRDIEQDKLSHSHSIFKDNVWSRSCCDVNSVNLFNLRKKKNRSFSEPNVENRIEEQSGPDHLYRASSSILSDVHTSELSLLCCEVLEKMEQKFGKKSRFMDNLSTKYALKTPNCMSDSSKDTLKLIGIAVKYLTGHKFDKNRQSNKTLDSVSSIKTYSADFMETVPTFKQCHNCPSALTTTAMISSYKKNAVK